MHRPKSVGKTMTEWKNSCTVLRVPQRSRVEGWKNMCTGDGRYVAISLLSLPPVNRGWALGWNALGDSSSLLICLRHTASTIHACASHTDCHICACVNLVTTLAAIVKISAFLRTCLMR